MKGFDPQDLSYLPSLPAEATEQLRQQMADRGRQDLFYLTKAILGYDKLNKGAHGALCKFLETCPLARRAVHMPRGHFKTTIGTISHTIQLVINDPNIRILIIAGTGLNAERFMLEIRKHFEMNPLFRWLYSEIIPENFNKARWNNQELEVVRTKVWREPTIDCIGSRGMAESRHYDYIKADDIIGKKEFESDTEMAKAVEWTLSLEPLLVNPSCRMDFIGSRWRRDDVYDAVHKHYGEDEKPVPIGPHAVKKGSIAIFTREPLENGEPIFPEQRDSTGRVVAGFSKKFFVRMMKKRPEYYAAQYANNPRAPGIATFREEWLRYWDWRKTQAEGLIDLFDHEGNRLSTLKVEQLDLVVFFDPSVAENKKSSRQGMIVSGKYDKSVIVLETHIGHYPLNEAIDLIFDIDKRLSPRAFSVERFGFQTAIKYWLNERAERDRLPYPPVLEYPPVGQGWQSSRKSKDERIRALQPFFRDGYIYLHKTQSELIEEYIYFSPVATQKDGLDALAHGPYYWEGIYAEDDDKEFEDAEEKLLASLDATGYGLKIA